VRLMGDLLRQGRYADERKGMFAGPAATTPAPAARPQGQALPPVLVGRAATSKALSPLDVSRGRPGARPYTLFTPQ
jgi:hypothetical protein